MDTNRLGKSHSNLSIVRHSPLYSILENFRNSAKSQREKGTYFEELIRIYFLNEPYYKDYYENVWIYNDWAKEEGKDARDVGIDLVARTRATQEFHAIQCKYVVNGKPALDWIIERYCVKTDKDSGIVNDANLWGIETENNHQYPLKLFQRVITVSLETMKIVKGLPELEV